MSVKDPSTTLSAEKQAKILAAAKARFLHYGVSKTTMRDIADDLNIAVSNLYLYFENKREIVLAIAETCRAEQEGVIREVLGDHSLTPGQKLERMLVNKFRYIREFRNDSPKGGELIAYLLQEFPERSKIWQDSLTDMIYAPLQEGVQKGVFHMEDPRHAANMLRIATGLFFLPPYMQLPIDPTEEELIGVIQWFLKMFEASKKGEADAV